MTWPDPLGVGAKVMSTEESAIAESRSSHGLLWISISALALGLLFGFSEPLVLVVVGPGLYAGPTNLGLLFLLCIAVVVLVGLLAIVVRTGRAITVRILALSACLAVGILGGNWAASSLKVSFAAPPPPVTITPTGEGWSRTSDLLVARSNHTATRLEDGRVLIAGGRGANEGTLASAELYDPSSGTWTATGNMLTPQAEHMATLLSDGRVLVVTGWSRHAELFDPTTRTWSETGSLLTRRTGHAATPLRDGRVLVTGGRTEMTGSEEAYGPPELFDPATGTWSAAGTMHEPRTGHTATLLADGRVLVAGGQGNETSPANQMGFLASAELYDPATGAWTVTGAMETTHFGHAAVLLEDGDVFVSGSVASPTSERFDPVTGTWGPDGNVESWLSPSATLLKDGRVLVVDGTGGLAVYDLRLPTATRTAQTAHGFGATATLLADDRVLIAGGVIMHYPGPGDVLAAAHLYDPR